MVVLFPLVPNGTDGHSRLVNDLKQCDEAGVTEWSDQLAQEWTWTDFAAGEGKPLKQFEALTDSVERHLGKFEISAVTRKFPLDHEVEESDKVLLGLGRQDDPVGHRLAADWRRPFGRALSKRACSLATTAPAST